MIPLTDPEASVSPVPFLLEATPNHANEMYKRGRGVPNSDHRSTSHESHSLFSSRSVHPPSTTSLYIIVTILGLPIFATLSLPPFAKLAQSHPQNQLLDLLLAIRHNRLYQSQSRTNSALGVSFPPLLFTIPFIIC